MNKTIRKLHGCFLFSLDGFSLAVQVLQCESQRHDSFMTSLLVKDIFSYRRRRFLASPPALGETNLMQVVYHFEVPFASFSTTLFFEEPAFIPCERVDSSRSRMIQVSETADRLLVLTIQLIPEGVFSV